MTPCAKPPVRLTRRAPRKAPWAVLGLCLLASACRIEHKAVSPTAANPAPTAHGAGQRGFEPKARVEAMWASQVLPALSARSADYLVLRASMRTDLDAAGARHGHRERGEGAPWNFATTLTGRIVSVDAQSSAGQLGVDADGDGQADALVQLGPILRGAALRDSLAFISFTDYTNQIEFAELASALNDHAYATVLQALPRDTLRGRHVELLGAFTSDDRDAPPTITPVRLKLGAAP